MGKRLEVLRRSESRDSLDSQSSRDSVTCRQPVWPLGQPSSEDKSSTLKGFFTRIGSAGVLTYSRLYSNSFREKLQQSRKSSSLDRQLYRSVSTSHLATSYMKGDDPADCLDRGGGGGGGGQPRNRDEKDAGETIDDRQSPTEPGYVPLKTRSCDNISKLGTKKPNFPYAFLRSRLSVLPEENGGGSGCVVGHLARTTVKLQRADDDDTAGAHEIVVTEELFKEMDNECREYRRVFSNLSSSNESGYDSDGPCRTSSQDAYHHHQHQHQQQQQHQQHRQKAADEDSGFGDTKSLTADSLNEFAEENSEPPPGRLLQQQQQQQHHSDKDYNVPSMCLFYKKNREINDRIRSERPCAKHTPNFHRRMFVKNRSPAPDLSSLPADLNGLRCHTQIVRLLKSRNDDDIGVYLKMLVKRVAEDYNETRFVVTKIEPGLLAYRLAYTYIIITPPPPGFGKHYSYTK